MSSHRAPGADGALLLGVNEEPESKGWGLCRSNPKRKRPTPPKNLFDDRRQERRLQIESLTISYVVNFAETLSVMGNPKTWRQNLRLKLSQH